MEVQILKEDNRTLLKVSGVIDEAGAESLKSHFNGLDLSRPQEVVLDMQEVPHLGSSAIGKILLLYKHLATVGGTLKVINLSTAMHELFCELKLDSLFSVSRA
jgi:anti-sigma B factor antagonist